MRRLTALAALAGCVLERIGADRHRLALAWPWPETKLDLIELVRVGS